MGTEAQGATIDIEAMKKEIGGMIQSAIDTALKPVTDGIAGQVKSLVEESIKPVVASVTELGNAHKALGEQIAKAPKGLSAEDLTKAVEAHVGKTLESRKQSEDAAAKKTALRKKIVEAKGLGKLDAAGLVNLPDTDDEKALGEAADKLAAGFKANNVALADVGGAAADGGESAKAAAEKAAKPGGFLKMPGAAA